jgi:hypothetical protein
VKDLDFVDDMDITTTRTHEQPLEKSVQKTSKTSTTSKKVAKKVHDDISSSNKQTKRHASPSSLDELGSDLEAEEGRPQWGQNLSKVAFEFCSSNVNNQP